MKTFKAKSLAVSLAVFLVISVGAEYTQDSTEHALHIDIRTKIEKANVVIDYGHAVLNGDLPFALADIGSFAADFRDWNTTGQIVVIVHGDAAYIALNDDTYNANRHVKTGNPYKQW